MSRTLRSSHKFGLNSFKLSLVQDTTLMSLQTRHDRSATSFKKYISHTVLCNTDVYFFIICVTNLLLKFHFSCKQNALIFNYFGKSNDATSLKKKWIIRGSAFFIPHKALTHKDLLQITFPNYVFCYII